MYNHLTMPHRSSSVDIKGILGDYRHKWKVLRDNGIFRIFGYRFSKMDQKVWSWFKYLNFWILPPKLKEEGRQL